MNRIWSRKTSSRVHAVLTAAMLAFLLFRCVTDTGMEARYFVISLAMGIAAVLISMMRKPTGAAALVISIPAAVVIPFAAMMMLQFFTLNPLRIYPQMMLVNAGFAYFFYLLLTFICGSFSVGYFIATAVFWLVGTVNYFVVSFRSSPIVPWDLYSVRTAFSVANNYSYELTWNFMIASAAFLLMLAIGRKITWRIRRIAVRIIFSVVCAFFLAAGGYLLQKDEVQSALSMDTILFTPSVRYRNNGFIAAFLGDLHLIRVEEPKNYSPKAVEEIARKTITAEEQEKMQGAAERVKSVDVASGIKPNIVVIMNEAFSDLSVLGDFEVSADYMPFMRSLMKEYAGGNLMVSVKGGNTANTEYEFLSGDTVAFLPEGSVAYQQFVHDNVPALPSYLAGLGYTTTAIHPYYASGWDRDKVYDRLGFRTFLSKADFSSGSEGRSLLRGYISDETAYEKIREVFEDRKAGEPQFVFEVTMQNHGGYSKNVGSFGEEILIEGASQSSTQVRAAEIYLTLLKKSDEALENLVRYFEESGEPVILVMFGDHQPSDYITNVISRITGYDPDVSLEETQKSYIVPYLIWNNYGLDVPSRDMVSVNFLAADIIEASGLPLTRYQSFLLELQKVLPAVSGRAYMDSAGKYYTYDQKNGDYDDLLNEYSILEYNHLIDTKNRVTEVFTQP